MVKTLVILIVENLDQAIIVNNNSLSEKIQNDFTIYFNANNLLEHGVTNLLRLRMHCRIAYNAWSRLFALQIAYNCWSRMFCSISTTSMGFIACAI